MLRNLLENTHCDVFTTEYRAATDRIKAPFFFSVESIVIAMIHRGVLDVTLNHSFNCSSQSDTFMPTLIRKIVNDSDTIAPIATFPKQPVINAVEKGLNPEPPLMEEIASTSDCSLSPPTSTTLDEVLKTSCLRHKQQN